MAASRRSTLSPAMSLPSRPAALNLYDLDLRKTHFAQTCPECRHDSDIPLRRTEEQIYAHRQRRLLRASRERPRRHVDDERDELTPFQFIELHSFPASQHH